MDRRIFPPMTRGGSLPWRFRARLGRRSSNMERCLVTGAAGFLGRYIVREMSAAGGTVLAVDSCSPENAALPKGVGFRSLRLPDERLGAVIADFAPTVCVHAAGRASVAGSFEDPDADFESSVLLTRSLLGSLGESAPRCRFVFLSSAAVYGEPESLPVSESGRILPLSPYGYHKRMCEMLVEESARLGGVRGASARIFSAYGPGLRRQVLWEAASQLAERGCVSLRGTGLESRDFISGRDVARAIRVIAEKAPCGGEVYNVASGQETTIRAAVEMLCAFFPGAPAPVFEGKKLSGDPVRWVADCSRLAALGFHGGVTIQEGLGALAEWTKAENGGK